MINYKLIFVTLVLILFASFNIHSQVTISGKVYGELSNQPLPGVEINEIGGKIKVFTDRNGYFTFIIDKKKIVNLSFVLDGYESYFSSANGKLSDQLDMGIIRLYPITKIDEEDINALNETELSEDDESQRVSSLLTSSWDIFSRTAAYNFGVARFRVRGLGNEYGNMYLNGMPMNNLDDGYIAWSIWGGLNDVMRRKNSSSSLEPAFFDFGALSGATNVSLLASDQWKQTRVSYAISNRSYRNRVMATYSTGMMDNGWALTLSGSRRWAQEGFKPGTFYDAYSGFISIDKKLGDKQLLNLVVLASPNKRGGAGGATKEMYELAGSHYYNSYWGYQNGKKRNSRVSNSFQPIAVLRHVWKPNMNTEINTSLGYMSGRYGRTRLDWYNAPDPRPDYYRYMPSYQLSDEMKSRLTNLYSNSEDLRQVNWADLYEYNGAGSGSILKEIGYTGDISNEKFSNYVLQEQRKDPTKFTFNTNIQTTIGDNTSIFGGLTYINQKTEYFQELVDLLGGTFYLNRDKFAERDFPDDNDKLQYDLNNPDKIVRVGDDYGYNYDINTTAAKAWGKALVSLNKIDAYLALELSNTSFYRDGHYKSGKFPENSFGKGEVHKFFNYGLKSGITFKLNGRNYIFANGLMMTKAPFARNTYLSPRTRDESVIDLKSENILGGEMAYVYKSPTLSIKALGYYTTIRNKTKTTSFYHDEQRSFVNYIMTGIDELHLGSELSAEYKVTSSLSVSGVAALGQYLYTSRPSATIAQDNNAEVLTDRTVYMKNYRIPGTPQKAMSFGLRYNSPKYWFATLAFNYFDDIWLDFFPDRRTDGAVDGTDKLNQPELWHAIIDQEKLPSNYTLDFFGGKSWKIGKKYIYLNVGVSNLLNNTDFITGGYEQYRFDYQSKDITKFPPKYFYAYGTNYYISLSLRL